MAASQPLSHPLRRLDQPRRPSGSISLSHALSLFFRSTSPPSRLRLLLHLPSPPSASTSHIRSDDPWLHPPPSAISSFWVGLLQPSCCRRLVSDALHCDTDDFSICASRATATSTSLPYPVPTTQPYLPPCLQIQALHASWIRPSPPPSPSSPSPSTHSPPDGKALHPLHLISSKPLVIAGFHMEIAFAIRSPGCHRPPLRPLVLESREMEDLDQGGRRSLDPSHRHLLPSTIAHHGGTERVGGDE